MMTPIFRMRLQIGIRMLTDQRVILITDGFRMEEGQAEYEPESEIRA